MLRNFLLLLFTFFYTFLFSQSHWESIVIANQDWTYLEASAEPPANWMDAGFDDSAWPTGQGGFGYGDDDDGTIVSNVPSVYLRTSFNLDAGTNIEELLLDIDYDDGFVAYLNGKEVARSANLTDAIPTYNSTLTIDHEAQIYQGLNPPRFTLSTGDLVIGVNQLAIQVINVNATSSDLSLIAYLQAKISGTTLVYNSTPSWFWEPLSFESSNLPIIKINTQGQEIPDDPKIVAHMGIINNAPGVANQLDGVFTDYDGRIAIEIRGQSSQMFPKKSFGFETQDSVGENNNVPLLGMPAENDWILYAPYTDKSLIRNVFTLELVKKLGHYSSRTAYCELYINDEYQGLYVLMEKIKRDKNRVDVAKLDEFDLTGEDVTGGYIYKVDKIDPDYSEGFTGWTSRPSPSYPNAMDVIYQFFYPKAEDILPEQKTYLKSIVNEVERVLISQDFSDPNTGYNKYFNTGSFVDFMLISELSKEVDKYRFSNYFHKQKLTKGGEIFAGPYWDFNLGYSNVNYWPYGNDPTGWLFTETEDHEWSIIFFWKRLMEDEHFSTMAKDRWQNLRENEFSDENISFLIDSLSNWIDPAQQRNYQKWPILGTYVWPNYNWEGNTYADELSYFSNWLHQRLVWMDNVLFGEGLNPSALLSIASYDENNDQLVLEINLVNDYFDHAQLEPKDFILENAPIGFSISEVDYKDAAKVQLALYAPDYNGTLGWSFGVTIKESKINSFANLTSNDVVTSIEEIRTNGPVVNIWTSSNEIVIDCSSPDQLGTSAYIYNALGQLVGSYPLHRQARNVMPLPQGTGVFIVSVNHASGRVAEKIVVH